MDVLVQAIVSGLVLGSLYALMTVGLAVAYGCLRTLNMAQGAFSMVGGYVAYFIVSSLGLPSILGLLAGMVAGAAFGVLAEFLAVKPFAGRKNVNVPMSVYMATLALAVISANAVTATIGAHFYAIPPLLGGEVRLFGGVSISWHSILIAVVSVGALVSFRILLKKTRHGLSLVAVSQQYDAARLMGVSPQAVYTTAMALAGALGGLAGVLLAPLYFISPFAGDAPLWKAIVVAVFAGLGSIGGAIWAALAIGLIEALSATYVSSAWSMSILFFVVLVVLMFKPNGLFGTAEEERL
jgi:branched-subunit amino acid ABC-type transport system permease component